MTPAEIAKLNKWQRSGQGHPYTCPGEFDHCGDVRDLVATPSGWICQCGAYHQDYDRPDKDAVLFASYHALKTYVHGNSSPDLAETVCDQIAKMIDVEDHGK